MNARIFFWLVVVGVLAACQSSDPPSTTVPTESNSTAHLPPSPGLSTPAHYPPTLIASGGGVVEGEEIRIVIPEGALEAATQFTISREASEAPIAVTEDRLEVGETFELGPNGTAFHQPVIVTLSYADYQSALGDLETRLVIFRESGGMVEALPSTVDTVAATVSAPTEHFSRFSLGIPMDKLHCEDIPGLTRV